MTSDSVRAAVNLHAVIRNFELLCLLDPEAKALIQDAKVRIIFRVPGVHQGQLTFADDICIFGPSALEVPEILLGFMSASHFNTAVAGAATPLPVRGLRHLRFLKRNFGELSSRLRYFLTSPPGMESNPAYVTISSTLLAQTAIFALAEIANQDEQGKRIAATLPDGALTFGVGDDLRMGIVADHGHLRAFNGAAPGARCLAEFDTLDTLRSVLRRDLDPYVAVNDGRLALHGHMPMLNTVWLLMHRVGAYLT